jgi:predicted AAA+ superfamily ATPase
LFSGGDWFLNCFVVVISMLSDEQLREILLEQRGAFLRKPIGVEREVMLEVEDRLNLPHVLVLTGLRRSGKSTLLRQIAKKHFSDKEFYYINFEDERLFNFPASEFNRLYEASVSLFGKKKTFFIDEIQNIANFESFVRRFFEDGFKFFITGSSANLLSKELGTKLTGRHLDTIVTPFSFKEFLELSGFTLEKNAEYITEQRVSLKKYFEEYLLKGGMPEYDSFNDPEILSKVYEDTVLKDIAIRYKINNVTNLRELYSYLITNFANTFSFTSLKKFISIKSVNTIKLYISYLEETYFVKTINKFDYSLKKQMVNGKKLYVSDNGFIRAVSKKVLEDKGWLLENLVFNSIKKEGDIFYYKDKRECDFLITKNKQVISAIQVCYELNDKNKEREINGLLEAVKKFKPKNYLILTNSQDEEINYSGKKIPVKSVWKWLLKE